MALGEQQIKEIIIAKLEQKMTDFHDENKTLIELVTFLTGLTTAKIKSAVIDSLNIEKALIVSQHSHAIDLINDTITEINNL